MEIRYCLYARKSTESEEKQILSIDSQLKEMARLAARENLTVVEVRRESHSAKATGQRPVFNQLLVDIREGKFNGILTWAPDRLSRNAGDLGALVDLMDQKLLLEIRTYGQRFENTPNEKFLLMILGSQAKLENDNRCVNIKRGMRARVEMGLWPQIAPLGYLNQGHLGKCCEVVLDPIRAPIVKEIFEKVGDEGWSGRKVYRWLWDEGFKTRGDKPLTLSGLYNTLANPFYYGHYEYPHGSGRWYELKHKPLITKELFDKVKEKLKRAQYVRENKEFAFTKLIACGICSSGITAQEKFKDLSDGTQARYVYYGCTRSKDRDCKAKYIREEELIAQLIQILDRISLNELGMKAKLEDEIGRLNRFQRAVLGTENLTEKDQPRKATIDIRAYAKYLLKEGSITEKRELLGNLRSRLVLNGKTVELVEESKTA